MHSFNLKSNLKNNEKVSSDALSNYAIFLLFAATLYQAFLCFIDTNVFSVSAAYLMLTEVCLIGVVALFYLRGPISISMLALLVLVFANTFVLTIFQQYFDPKIIRNLMTPILIIWLGMQYNHKLSLDSIMKKFAIIVIVIGIFEFILPDIYQHVFNVLNYQISVGRSTDAALKYAESSFSLNGTRWGGRNLLPFLGDHRSSSIFLETVNMGNFGVLLAAWGLSKKSIKSGAFFIAAALIVAVLADSRFASTLIALLLIMRFTLPPKLLEAISYLSPLFVLMVCFYLESPAGMDDFKGRLGSTGYYILHFRLSEYFGLSSYHYSKFVDQGYAYLIHFSGILMMLVLWFSFCRLRMSSEEGNYFKCLVAVLIAANLAISGDSIFSIKWVAIMWFLIGALSFKKAPQNPQLQV